MYRCITVQVTYHCQHYTHSAQHCRDVTTLRVSLYTMCDMAGLHTGADTELHGTATVAAR